MKFLVGKKLGSTQVFDEKGEAFPVTLIEAGPCVVTEIKNLERDGYDAVQLGFEKVKENKVTKPLKNKPFRHLKEIRGTFDVALGDSISASIFSVNDKLLIRGVSKGKGFAGVMKRWNFSGSGTATHGTKHTHRTPGSIGSAYPQKVMKGKKMAGRLGTESITVKNLQVIKVDLEKNTIAVKGAIPGKNGGIITIEKI
jgi:large subunit ribosomal protein L3